MMKKYLTWSLLCLLGALLATGGAYLYKRSATKKQLAARNSLVGSLDALRSEVTQLNNEFSEERLQAAKSRAETARDTVKTVGLWNGIVGDLAAQGVRIEQTATAAQNPAVVQIKATLRFEGLPANDATMVMIQKALHKLDVDMPGCQRVALHLVNSTNKDGLPRGQFGEGSAAHYEFSLYR